MRVDFAELNLGIASLRKAINSQTNDPNDNITMRLENFKKNIEEEKNKIEAKIKKCEESYEKCAAFFCENPKESSEKFGEKFLKFSRTV